MKVDRARSAIFKEMTKNESEIKFLINLLLQLQMFQKKEKENNLKIK